jgi:hypothetical protein
MQLLPLSVVLFFFSFLFSSKDDAEGREVPMDAFSSAAPDMTLVA